jgi:beta-N-acetylhexosaminidase
MYLFKMKVVVFYNEKTNSKYVIDLCFFLFGCNSLNTSTSHLPSPDSNNYIIEPPIKEVDFIQIKVDAMSLEEKVGQLVVVGFDGFVMNDDLISLIKENKVSGVILFSKNVESSNQLISLTNLIKTSNSQNKSPLFISVDEEGGRVSRMPKEIRKLPSNKIIDKKMMVTFATISVELSEKSLKS